MKLSNSKLKYFLVTQETIVRANNQADAEALASGKRNVTGTVMSQDWFIERLPATEAHSLVASV